MTATILVALAIVAIPLLFVVGVVIYIVANNNGQRFP